MNGVLGRVRVGEFELDPSSGELTRLHQNGRRGETRRLPPQPAQLLVMLIEKRGSVLTRAEIQQGIWPEVEVDFEQGLNFCVRQVRSALDDSAGAPRYVETLPRRGYRLLAEVEPLGAGSEAPEEPAAGPVREGGSRRRHWWLGATVAAVALVLALWGAAFRASSQPPRIGILPFTAPAGFAGGADTEPIAERILVDLTQRAGRRAEVLGPRSTSGYRPEPASLRRMASELDLDYLINAKFLRESGGERLLVELIRTSDGAHVWVEAFPDPAATLEIAAATVAGTLAQLGLAAPADEAS